MSRLPPVLAHLPLPIIGSPLFIISNPKLVIAQCKAGVVGSMPALNARPASQLDEWLAGPYFAGFVATGPESLRTELVEAARAAGMAVAFFAGGGHLASGRGGGFDTDPPSRAFRDWAALAQAFPVLAHPVLAGHAPRVPGQP